MDSNILKLEHDIATFIGSDNKCTVHFEYKIEDPKFFGHPVQPKTEHTVSAYTVNPNHEETFLLKTDQ